MTYDQRYIRILESLRDRELAEQRIKKEIENLAEDRKRFIVVDLFSLPDDHVYREKFREYTNAIFNLKDLQDDLTRIWED